MEINARDRDGKRLAVGQRVSVVVGRPGWTRTGIVTEVNEGSSCFRDENDGGLWRRTNGNFHILEEKHGKGE